MKHLLIVLLLSLTIGCARFDKRAVWPDSAYGGPLEAVALEGYSIHHSPWKTDVKTGPTYRSAAQMHIDPDPIAYCVTHSIYSATELEKRVIDYNLVILTDSTGIRDPHSVILTKDENGVDVYIEINQSEPYTAEEYRRFWDTERNLGHVKAKNIHGVLAALGYTYK